ncbi:MAG: TIGR04283 family arsenosugar biosynthesis glycosyltransferase [Mogibacterium sp.]|nr:TIGR04283 family arsenosugar biosynthesis glycosyltransferase [Mogibacterium sp.]
MKRRSKDGGKKNAYVVFTREPVPGTTKTRLMPYYSAEKCAELHKCFLKDLSREVKRVDADIIVAYTGGEPVFLRKTFGSRAAYIAQRGNNLGQKMENAFADAFALGYENVILTGTDIPELKADSVNSAFEMLDSCDIVLGPTSDGGYYLIGMSSLHHEAFDVKLYGVSTVFEETTGSIRSSGFSVSIADEYSDIDDKEDIAGLMERIRGDRSVAGPDTRRFLMENIAVSIIVPLYNEELTVNTMMDQLRPYKDEAEIIFVDGGSSDATLTLIGDEFRVISCERGRGRQLNEGVAASCGDVLFFLHCDSVLPKGFLGEIKRCMMRKPFGCFGVRFDSNNFFMLTNRIISNYRAALGGVAFGDQGMFIERKLFFDEGMFPEIPVMEDYEFSIRMKKRGYRPAMARRRILTSSRRYGKGTVSIVKTEMLMFYLRMLYRMGEDPSRLKQRYKDIRGRQSV